MKKKKTGCLTIILAVLALFIATDLFQRFVPSRICRALPSSAKNINEKWMGLGFFGDFSRILKAQLPEKDYFDFVQSIGLETKYEPKLHAGKEWGFVDIRVGGPEWWDEPSNLENCFFAYQPGREYVCRVQYRNGYVYFTEVKW